MKRIVSILVALVLCFALTAVCSAEAEEQTATYTVYNVTGEKVVELYANNIVTGEQSENYAGEEGLADGAVCVITKTAAADATDKDHFVLDLTFTTESGYTGSFPTLHFETVPISLLSQETAAGATAISFSVPEVSCAYTVYNMTGEKVTALYANNTVTGEVSENYASEGLENGAVCVITKTVAADAADREHFVIDLNFTTESGYTGSFPTLHFETVPITLLSQETAAGATAISFSVPQVSCTYTVYNTTGEKVTALYANNTVTGEVSENYAGEGLEDGAMVEITMTVAADAADRDHFVIDLNFTTESGYTGSFPTLHFETVPISLLSQETAAGATAISFSAPAAE